MSSELVAEFVGTRYCDHFNRLLDSTGLGVLLQQSQNDPTPLVTITTVATREDLGEAYAKAFREWACSTVVSDLVKQIDVNRLRFKHGTFGSVWLDLTLHGSLDGVPKAKRARISLLPKEPPHLTSRGVRVVNGTPRVVKIRSTEGDECLLADGARVPRTELVPFHKLGESMMYVLTIDPTRDGEAAF